MNMIKRKISASLLLLTLLASLSFLMSACRSVDQVDRVSASDVREEGTIIFTRPARYTMFFGTYSQRDFIEIVYENFSINSAGQAVVEVGIRYRGPTGWTNWMNDAPDSMSLATRCNFYRAPLSDGAGPIVYSTNRREIVIKRGETYAYRAACPRQEARGYQLVLGE